MAVGDENNDLRGWILCLASGIACVLGASIICVDSLVRLLPGKKDFHIQNNTTFQACSLSLSFGVMLFMSLYSMLPEAKSYFTNAHWSNQKASFILIACFVGGFVGIQILSRLFHRLLPSHVVDCDHSHDKSHVGHSHSVNSSSHVPRRQSSRTRSIGPRDDNDALAPNDVPESAMTEINSHPCETTPLIPNGDHSHGTESSQGLPKRSKTVRIHGSSHFSPMTRSRATTGARRPSVMQMPKRVMSFMKDTKPNCDEGGPCFGYTDPCGQECFKHVTARGRGLSRLKTFQTNTTYTDFHASHEVDEDDDVTTLSPTERRMSRAYSHTSHGNTESECDSVDLKDLEAQNHHHHVAKNAFLSIGLQTSVAIALHKLPEGFITYATNHANPALGFDVFLALFVHNISEGFALALPLYMALGSRLKAILWSFLLGGLSQPLGAGLAFVWFKIANKAHVPVDGALYGCLFSATAGIMVSVALQLFVESLSLNHNKNLSILFAFLGMTLLGLSNAFTSEVH
ncbi:Zinc/iron permease [Xylariaceae sp. FL0255]|nr:Zinc/iron permease [Xylariaceae sp. FL0255]